jgi:hypothetical protein
MNREVSNEALMKYAKDRIVWMGVSKQQLREEDTGLYQMLRRRNLLDSVFPKTPE